MRAWTRRPAFWVAYAVVACIGALVALQLFPLAIPLVHLDVRMARHDAIDAARTLGERLGLAPTDARTAVRFTHDDETQNFIELEGGGKPAFAKLLEGNAYSPYWWDVRLFAPGEITESIIRFRPDGSRYGFLLKLPETFVPADPAGLALSADDARRIAERDAAADWGVDFKAYRPLDQTQQRRPNGRMDHLFVYERTDVTAGDARFRLRLGVAGNRFDELTYFTFIPEAFERRFEELRATNNTIAGAATLAAGVLYGLGGCILGVLWLMRQHWLVWRPALVAGLIVGGLMGLTSLAAAPTAWFAYDTAEPIASFWLRQVGSAVLVLFGGGLAYAFVFMAAEGLSRRAFAHHPQLWRLWTRDAAASPQILGRTLGGYLFVGIELALIAAFYYATNRWLGWWQPSESLTDPNILGSAVPALAPIAISLQAGFMEESVFRAVPLSLAALIGARYGRRGLAIGIAAVLQALIFGSAHANYPGFPAYSRLVELLLPSLIWALLFLRFGLLVTILLHALFDLTLFAIPLFLVDAPGASLQRSLVVAAGLVPLAIVLLQRLRAGAWRELPERLRNGAWLRSPPPEEAPVHVVEDRPLAGWVRQLHRALPVLGIAGFVVWLLTTSFRADVPTLPLSRADAIVAAERVLLARGVVLDSAWKRFARVRLATDEAASSTWHEFVWREGGPAAYARLMGNILAPPLWEVRFARFSGDVAERAEEWRITVQGTGDVRQIRHVLPEARPGATLERDAAQTLAERALRDQLHSDPARLRLVGAEQKQEPARRDWSFVFSDPAAPIDEGGEGRMQVVIAGDEVVNAGRYVYIPEAWERTQRERESRLTFAKLALAAFSGVALVAGLVFAAGQWMRRRFSHRVLYGVATISFLLTAVGIANNWPQLAMNLKTSEPVATQVGLSVLAGLLGAVFAALVVGFVSAVGAWAALRQPRQRYADRWPAWAAGTSAALIVAGLEAGLSALAPQTAPIWPSYGVAGQAVPALGAALVGAGVLGAIGGALFVLAWLEHLTRGWRRHLWLACIVLVLALTTVAVVGAANPLGAMIGGLIGGAAAVVVVYGVLRFDLRSVPAYIGTGAVLGMAETAARNGTAMSTVYGAIAIVVAIAVTAAVTRYMRDVAADPVA